MVSAQNRFTARMLQRRLEELQGAIERLRQVYPAGEECGGLVDSHLGEAEDAVDAAIDVMLDEQGD